MITRPTHLDRFAMRPNTLSSNIIKNKNLNNYERGEGGVEAAANL